MTNNLRSQSGHIGSFNASKKVFVIPINIVINITKIGLR